MPIGSVDLWPPSARLRVASFTTGFSRWHIGASAYTQKASEREKLLFRARCCRRDSVALATAASARKSLGAPKKAAQEDGRASREGHAQDIIMIELEQRARASSPLLLLLSLLSATDGPKAGKIRRAQENVSDAIHHNLIRIVRTAQLEQSAARQQQQTKRTDARQTNKRQKQHFTSHARTPSARLLRRAGENFLALPARIELAAAML